MVSGSCAPRQASIQLGCGLNSNLFSLYWRFHFRILSLVSLSQADSLKLDASARGLADLIASVKWACSYMLRQLLRSVGGG